MPGILVQQTKCSIEVMLNHSANYLSDAPILAHREEFGEKSRTNSLASK